MKITIGDRMENSKLGLNTITINGTKYKLWVVAVIMLIYLFCILGGKYGFFSNGW